VEFTKDPAAAPYFVVLPQPVATACVDLVLDTVYPGAEAQGGSNGRTAIAEMVVLTDLDAGGERALDGLARAVAAGGNDAIDAEHHLATQGARGAAALVTAARASSDDPSRRRLRLALARLGDPAGAAEVAAGLAAAGTPEDAEAFAQGLAAMGPPGVPSLGNLLAGDAARPEARARAARVLARVPGATARDVLLAAAGKGPREVRTAVILGLAARPVEEAAAVGAALGAEGERATG